MTPDERLVQAVWLTELSGELFKAGLRSRFPDMPEDELKRLYLERLDECHVLKLIAEGL